MGKRGPRPDPEARLARGSPYRARERDIPAPEPGPRRAPPWLDNEARKVWYDLCPRIAWMQTLGLADYYALAVFCDTWSRWRRAREFLDKHGESHLVRDRAGNAKGVRLYPHVRLADRLAEQVVRLARELGITPTSRGRAAVIPDWSHEAHKKAARKDSKEVAARLWDPTVPAPPAEDDAEAGDDGDKDEGEGGADEDAADDEGDGEGDESGGDDD